MWLLLEKNSSSTAWHLLLRKTSPSCRCSTGGNQPVLKAHHLFYVEGEHDSWCLLYLKCLFWDRIIVLKESGLLQHQWKRHTEDKHKCNRPPVALEQRKTALDKTIGAFVVLTVGLSASTFVFVLEFLVSKFSVVYSAASNKVCWRRSRQSTALAGVADKGHSSCR